MGSKLKLEEREYYTINFERHFFYHNQKNYIYEKLFNKNTNLSSINIETQPNKNKSKKYIMLLDHVSCFDS